jgi:gamma-glutamylcyclotransferase (GGCT)/AIG2-like uncharacterized protein YtfP
MTTPFHLIEVTGDYSKIGDIEKFLTDTSITDWVFPNAYHLKFHTNPPPELVQKVIEKSEAYYTQEYLLEEGYPVFNPADVISEIIQGFPYDHLLHSKNHLIIFTSPDHTPEEYLDEFLRVISEINTYPGEVTPEEDVVSHYIQKDPSYFTKEYLDHIEALESPGSGYLMSPRVTLEFQIL